MADQQNPPTSTAKPVDPLDLATSVAGEEDPGAAIDMEVAPQRKDQPGASQGHLRPGDEAPQGTPGTGETVCPRCGGSGKLGASNCPTCEGTGKVTVGIGGA